jgi:GNAT superfamily N-acetyltransferase
MDVQIRRIRPSEHLAAGAVCLAAYEPFFTGAEDFYRDRVRDVARRDVEAQVWVAVDGDEVIGCVTYCPPGSGWREIGLDDEGEFRMLSVAPTAQGRGVGTALARTCEEQARSHGAVAMALSSLPVMTAAHGIYARLGYARLPERDWSPAPGVQLIAFGKRLD